MICIDRFTCYAVLCKWLEHLQIHLTVGVLRPIPRAYSGTTAVPWPSQVIKFPFPSALAMLIFLILVRAKSASLPQTLLGSAVVNIQRILPMSDAQGLMSLWRTLSLVIAKAVGTSCADVLCDKPSKSHSDIHGCIASWNFLCQSQMGQII